MQNILNITSGDSAVEIMKRAGIPGEYLPWQDVLHDGPVPASLSFQELSDVRAQFIVDQGWGAIAAVKESFTHRNTVLEQCERYDHIVLWFEHDLYDQLQLIQILDYFSNASASIKISMVCRDTYLGTCSPNELSELKQYEAVVTSCQLALGKKAWHAFRSSTPETWHALLSENLSLLPFLRDAVIRLLEEYPNCQAGLSRTEAAALQIVAAGEVRPGRIFGEYQKMESARFMGDLSFWTILNGLLLGASPLLKLSIGEEVTVSLMKEQRLSITDVGRAVLTGEIHRLDILPVDKWIGGVHLTPQNMWCFDHNLGKVSRWSI